MSDFGQTNQYKGRRNRQDGASQPVSGRQAWPKALPKALPGGMQQWGLEQNHAMTSVNIVSFNVGIDQQMLLSQKSWNKHGQKLASVVHQFFYAEKGDIVCLSELGGAQTGP